MLWPMREDGWKRFMFKFKSGRPQRESRDMATKNFKTL